MYERLLPSLKTLAALLGLAFIALEALQSFPSTTALRQFTLPLQNQIDNVGLYGRTWSMFAGTNTSTSAVTLVMEYANGTEQNYQYLNLRASYLPTVWNEVMQDIQYDINNDYQGRYKAGFLRYTCQHPPIGDAKPVFVELVQERVFFVNNQSNSQVIGSLTCPAS